MAKEYLNPNGYREHNFLEIPEGNHRVQIYNITKKKVRNEMIRFEITYRVSGYHGKLWHVLWYVPDNMYQTEKQFSSFFDSFQIPDCDQNINCYRKWVGRRGAVRVVHDGEFNGEIYKYSYAAKVTLFLSGALRDSLPTWREAPINPYESAF